MRLDIFIILLLCFTDLSAQDPIALGKLSSSKLTEISGITPYGFEKGYFWVHNDSGDKNAIYLIDSLAQFKQEVELEGVHAVDFEDIARFENNGMSYLIVGDLGNNLRNRDTLDFYIFKEPKYENGQQANRISPSEIKHLRFYYKDKARDAEAFFVDPMDKHIYIFSKRDLKSTVFRLSIDAAVGKTHGLSALATLPFTFSTGADISNDGQHILVKNLTTIYYWERKKNESVVDAIKRTPKSLPYQLEPQGEAICFDLQSRVFYTISERPFGLASYLFKYTY